MKLKKIKYKKEKSSVIAFVGKLRIGIIENLKSKHQNKNIFVISYSFMLNDYKSFDTLKEAKTHLELELNNFITQCIKS